jgi:hypothetical protein
MAVDSEFLRDVVGILQRRGVMKLDQDCDSGKPKSGRIDD